MCLKGGKMLQRKANERFIQWKTQKNKKALLVTGARQIGKTHSIREFARSNYKKMLEINFIDTPSAMKIFDSDLDADTLITSLTAFSQEELIPEETIIFFDEIQECPRARTAIKFLVEDGRFDYIESGSLLGVNYKEVPSYPVGFEEVFQMFPLDFEEFCWANGVQKETVSYLKECFDNKKTVTEAVHQKMLQLFRYYVIVGGMPAVVQSFVDTHDIAKSVQIQKDILALYRQDITKYSKNDKERIKDIFDRIPSELNSKNRRFSLADINPNARMNRYESSFMWLADAGVTLPCYNVKELTLPLEPNELRNLMKVFMNDTGLLCAMSIGNIQFDILQGNFEVNMGSIIENVIAQELICNGFKLRYFDRKNLGELDFIIQKNNSLIALEIKSGKDYHRHAALQKILYNEDLDINEGYVFCIGNIEIDGKTTYFPLYMIQFLKQVSLPEKLVVNVDLP